MELAVAVVSGLCVAIPSVIATGTAKKKREIPSSFLFLGLSNIIKIKKFWNIFRNGREKRRI